MGQLVPIQDKVTDLVAYVNDVAEAAARMVGGTAADGKAVALVCYQEGITFLEFRKRYHLVDGKPTMRADAMLAEFRLNHGGRHKVLECSPERVAIKLIDADGDESEWSTTWKEMAETRWPWKPHKINGKHVQIAKVPVADREIKDNWSTPKDKQDMMFARLVSDSLRKICPELVAGVYTPEETADFAYVDDAADGETMRRQTASEALKAQGQSVGQPPSDTYAATTDEGEVIDASFTVEEETAKHTEPASQEFDDDGQPAEMEVKASNTQLNRMSELRKKLGVGPDKWNATLAKRNVAVEADLSFADAKDIIARMEEAAAKK